MLAAALPGKNGLQATMHPAVGRSLWRLGMHSGLFVLGGLRLFGFLLLLPFGLVLLALLVAHGVAPLMSVCCRVLVLPQPFVGTCR